MILKSLRKGKGENDKEKKTINICPFDCGSFNTDRTLCNIGKNILD